MSFTNSETEQEIEDLSSVCRGCLASTGEMKNMREWGLLEKYHKITNIEVDSSEGLTELLCTNCEDNLRQYSEFTEQCMTSFLVLKNAKIKQSIISPIYKSKSEVNNTIFSELHNDKLVIMITAPNSELKIHLSCPYCTKNDFLKKSDLSTHILRSHGGSKHFVVELKYYCPNIECSYHRESKKGKFFHGRKFLNQHIVKVHNNASIHCKECQLRFPTESHFNRHLKTCNYVYVCQMCNINYKTNQLLQVHLLRKHPDVHKQYKGQCKIERQKQKLETENSAKKIKLETSEYLCCSPKRSFATQTLEENIRNDVRLPSWQADKVDEIKRDEISTQTFDMLNSQMCEDESIFSSETVSLSDIQTQTTPVEFGLCRSNKETITSETQSPDLSIKETQTCLCLYDSPKPFRLLESVSSSPSSMFTSTETQTLDSIL